MRKRSRPPRRKARSSFTARSIRRPRRPLIKDFNALYPDIKVEYNDMNSTEIYNRFIAEAASGQGSADVMWSSAMDLQVKLVDDGQALTYASPEASKLPTWAVYKNQAYGTDVRAGRVHLQQAARDRRRGAAGSRRVLEAPCHEDGQVQGQGDDVRHREERRRLHVRRAGREVLPRHEGTGEGFGATSYRVYSSTGNMLEKVSSGEHLLGYNVLGSYALVRAKKDPNLGVVLPKDYTLVLSRVLFIGKQAKNPNAAKVWADYILSHARPEADRQRRRALLRSAPTSTPSTRRRRSTSSSATT